MNGIVEHHNGTIVAGLRRMLVKFLGLGWPKVLLNILVELVALEAGFLALSGYFHALSHCFSTSMDILAR